MKNANNTGDHRHGDPQPSSPPSSAVRSAYTAKETAYLLGGISARSLRRLEQRGLLLPSRGLRTKLYSRLAIEKYLGETI
jgi:hypothetical protein